MTTIRTRLERLEHGQGLSGSVALAAIEARLQAGARVRDLSDAALLTLSAASGVPYVPLDVTAMSDDELRAVIAADRGDEADERPQRAADINDSSAS